MVKFSSKGYHLQMYAPSGNSSSAWEAAFRIEQLINLNGSCLQLSNHIFASLYHMRLLYSLVKEGAGLHLQPRLLMCCTAMPTLESAVSEHVWESSLQQPLACLI